MYRLFSFVFRSTFNQLYFRPSLFSKSRRVTPIMSSFMATLNQKRRFAKKLAKRLKRVYDRDPETVLKGPQRKGVIIKVFAVKPKKPNSGQRKSVMVRLSNGKKVVAYMPGQKALAKEGGIALIRGGNVQDCPGLKYKVLRGKYDVN